jgi:hypothetical protein
VDTSIRAAGYMIQDRQGNAIYGVGKTVDEAWEMAVDGAGPFFGPDGETVDNDWAYSNEFKTYGATAALIEQVMQSGGDCSWHIVSGVACTDAEGEAND